MIHSYKGKKPVIATSAFVADYVTITGDVTIGEDSSIWFATTIRGDSSPVVIGNRVNVQDNSVLHQSDNTPLIIEDDVSIGHQCILHGCKIGKGALIGMGSIVLDNAEIGEGAMIGAGSLVPPGKKIPPYTLALGRPAKVVRELTEKDNKYLGYITEHYVQNGKDYKYSGELQIVPVNELPIDAVPNFFKRNWGTTEMVISSGVYRCDELDGFAAIDDTGEIVGMITYVVKNEICEIILVDTLIEKKGIGTALILAVETMAKEASCTQISLITTNDNVGALTFFQKRGFQMIELYVDAVELAREIKPSIPLVANNGIPIRDEILLAKEI